MTARPPWTALFALLGGTFTTVLSMSFLFPATPFIMHDFGVSMEAAAWLSLSYALGATVFEPMLGRLGDIHGRKRNVVLGLATFVVGAVVAALSPQFVVMLTARFLQGLGAAAVIPVGMAFVGEHFPAEVRGRALGLWSMVNGVAPAIGPSLGGVLIDLYGWRAIYWASALLGLVGLALVVSLVPESRRGHQEPFDYAGSAALFTAVASLLTLLTQGRTWGWLSPTCLVLAALAIVGAAVFITVEQHAGHPIVDLSFVGRRTFLMPALIVFLSFFTFQGSFFMLPFFLEQVQGYNARQAGGMAIPLFTVLAVASFSGGRISDRFRAKGIVLGGAVSTGMAIFLLTGIRVDTPYWHIALVMAILGLGIGVTLPPLSRSVIGMVDARQMGAVSGIFNMIRNLGGPFGTAAAATLFANRVAIRAQEAFLQRAVWLGVPPDLLGAFGQASQPVGNAIDPVLAGKLSAVAPEIADLQQYARTHGMAAAMADVGWLLLAICVLMLAVSLFLPNLRPLGRDARRIWARVPAFPPAPARPRFAPGKSESKLEGTKMADRFERDQEAAPRDAPPAGGADAGAGAAAQPPRPSRAFRRGFVAVLLVAAVPFGAVFGYQFWEDQERYVSTDNAQIVGVTVQAGSLNAGRVQRVTVDTGDPVARDQLVAIITIPAAIGLTHDGTPKLTFRNTDDQQVAVRSPIDGVVTTRQANPGDTIAAWQPILTVLDPTRLWVQARVEETKIGRVRRGQPVDVKVDSLQQSLSGRVIAVGRATAPASSFMLQAGSGSGPKLTQLVPVKIALDYGQLPLVLGGSVEVRIHVRE